MPAPGSTSTPTFNRLLLWTLRVAWALLPLVAGPAFAAALDERSRPVQLTATVGLWAAWAVVLVATLVLHPMTLTTVRVGAPAGVAAAIVAALAGSGAGPAIAAVVMTVVNAIVALLPETAMPFVNGPAYANERRFPLRAPGPLLVGPLELAWAATVGLPAIGVLLLAARQWIAGGIITLVGLAVGFVLGRSMYTLANRWFVFVPAGVVLHDPMSLADPILFRRKDVHSLGTALADTDATDLTARAFGLALELHVKEPAKVAVVTPGRTNTPSVTTTKLLFTPTRPGAVLAEARERRID
jgi:hypothetical protein